MIPEFLVKKYGTDDANVIYTAKTTGNQHRTGLSTEKPHHVSMTPNECKGFCEKAGITYEKGYEERVIRYTCSDDSVDRMGDVIKQNGWKLGNFKSNPVIMANHNYGEFPVGNALTAGVSGNKLKMDILFAGKNVSEKADEAFRLSKAGFMRAGSVGFAPHKFHMPDEAEQKELGMDIHAGVVFDEQELLEFSVCGVPANANAIQESIAKGLVSQKDFDALDGKSSDDKDDKKKKPKKDGGDNDNAKDENSTIDDIDDKGAGTSGELDKEGNPKKEIDPQAAMGEAFKFLIDKEVKAQLETLIEEKQGAVLSKKSKNQINDAIEGMAKAMTALKALLGDVESEKDKNDDNQSGEKSSDDSLIIDLDIDNIGEPSDEEALYFDVELDNI